MYMNTDKVGRLSIIHNVYNMFGQCENTNFKILSIFSTMLKLYTLYSTRILWPLWTM